MVKQGEGSLMRKMSLNIKEIYISSFFSSFTYTRPPAHVRVYLRVHESGGEVREVRSSFIFQVLNNACASGRKMVPPPHKISLYARGNGQSSDDSLFSMSEIFA
jgi:hypothetical protein